MTRLSVNINKIATLRNARGGNRPHLLSVAHDCEEFGAQGITVHPRPDERHIRYQDVLDLKGILTTEFNIEGYPSPEFCDLVCRVQPHQVTLVPDAPGQLTSDHGWDIKGNATFLTDVIGKFKERGIRVSVFVSADEEVANEAIKVGANRIELYTEPYASNFDRGERLEIIQSFIRTAEAAREVGLGVNAGHDLNLDNLGFFHQHIPWIDEVSIGHALICDALYLGLHETIHRYLACLK